ncbi:MAG: hypothetical protein ACNY01_12935, partial [Desulfobacteria bacterium]
MFTPSYKSKEIALCSFATICETKNPVTEAPINADDMLTRITEKCYSGRIGMRNSFIEQKLKF